MIEAPRQLPVHRRKPELPAYAFVEKRRMLQATGQVAGVGTGDHHGVKSTQRAFGKAQQLHAASGGRRPEAKAFQRPSQPSAKLPPGHGHRAPLQGRTHPRQLLQDSFTRRVVRERAGHAQSLETLLEGVQKLLRRMRVTGGEGNKRSRCVLEAINNLLCTAREGSGPRGGQATAPKLQVLPVTLQAAGDVLMEDQVLLKPVHRLQQRAAIAIGEHKRRFQQVQHWQVVEVLLHAFQPALQRGRGTGRRQGPAGGVVQCDSGTLQERPDTAGQAAVPSDDSDVVAAFQDPAPRLNLDGPGFLFGMVCTQDGDAGQGAVGVCFRRVVRARGEIIACGCVDKIQQPRAGGRSSGSRSWRFRLVQLVQQALHDGVGMIVIDIRIGGTVEEHGSGSAREMSAQPLRLGRAQHIDAGYIDLERLVGVGVQMGGEALDVSSLGVGYAVGAQLPAPRRPQGMDQPGLLIQMGRDSFRSLGLHTVTRSQPAGEIARDLRDAHAVPRQLVKEIQEAVGQCPRAARSEHARMLAQGFHQRQLARVMAQHEPVQWDRAFHPRQECIDPGTKQGFVATRLRQIRQSVTQPRGLLHMRQQDDHPTEIRQVRGVLRDHVPGEHAEEVLLVGNEKQVPWGATVDDQRSRYCSLSVTSAHSSASGGASFFSLITGHCCASSALSSMNSRWSSGRSSSE